MRAMTDAELIDKAGGPTRLAALLGLNKRGSVQRVSNWRARGIPPRVRLDHARVFEELAQIGTEGAPAVPAEEARDAA